MRGLLAQGPRFGFARMQASDVAAASPAKRVIRGVVFDMVSP